MHVSCGNLSILGNLICMMVDWYFLMAVSECEDEDFKDEETGSKSCREVMESN